MSQKFALLENLEDVLPAAFAEDMPDLTSKALYDSGKTILAEIRAKQQGVICGLSFLPYIFSYRMASVSVAPKVRDGDLVQPDQVVASVEGSSFGILTAERIALNVLQVLSGIATLTRKFVSLTRDTGVSILDTRKTRPGWRLMEKYAVRVGGGKNHRMGAFDAYLLKENHKKIAGGIRPAVEAIRKHREDNPIPVIVEVSTMEELKEAIRLKVDRIMLDNMNEEMIRQAVSIAAGQVPLEVSGGVNLQNVKSIAETGVQYISIGALTHSAPVLDLSLIVTNVQRGG